MQSTYQHYTTFTNDIMPYQICNLLIINESIAREPQAPNAVHFIRSPYVIRNRKNKTKEIVLKLLKVHLNRFRYYYDARNLDF